MSGDEAQGLEQHAAAARALCESVPFGTLATLAREPAGSPFASVVGFALDAEWQPLFLLSGIAEHTLNVAVDPRASLLVVQDQPVGKSVSPLALGRVTLTGRVAAVPDATASAAREWYVAAHAEAERYFQLPDFRFYRLETEAIRYVGGFGRMAWVPRELFALPSTRAGLPARG
jgi:heme iron utilization protein